MHVDTADLERVLEELVEVCAVLEVIDDQLVVSGLVETEQERRATLHILRQMAPQADIVDNLEVEMVVG